MSGGVYLLTVLKWRSLFFPFSGELLCGSCFVSFWVLVGGWEFRYYSQGVYKSSVCSVDGFMGCKECAPWLILNRLSRVGPWRYAWFSI